MPERPNTKEDADRTSRPASKPRPSNHDLLMDWYRKNASYIDPETGWMYFSDNYRVNSGGTDIRYPDGSIADAIPTPGTPNPPKSALSNRYTIDPPLPQTLGNRYTMPTANVWEQAARNIGPQIKSAYDGINQQNDWIELAKRAGYLK